MTHLAAVLRSPWGEITRMRVGSGAPRSPPTILWVDNSGLAVRRGALWQTAGAPRGEVSGVARRQPTICFAWARRVAMH